MKKLLITSGFPRSGNSYLNQALQLFYYPKEKVNQNKHTVKAIKEIDKIIVPFRNPLDAISSWNTFPSNGTLENDIEFYVRFYSFVCDNINKIVLMDFDEFTKNLNYLTNKINNNLNITTDRIVTNERIKQAMIENNRSINLPRNNKEELECVKKVLQTIPKFNDCLELHTKLKNYNLLN